MDDLKIVWVDISGFRVLGARHFFDLRDPRGGVSDQMIVAGTNGGGKTTLLEAILFGLGREDLMVRDLPAKERKASWRGRFPEGARVSVCISIGGRYYRADRTNGAPIWAAIDHPFAAVGNPAEVTFGPSASQVEYFTSWRAPALLGPVWPTTAGRKAADTEANRLRNIKQRIVDQKTLESYGTNVGLHDSWLNTLNDAWASLHLGEGTTLADQPVVPGQAEAGFDLYLLERDGTRRCSVDQLSAGEIETLCMAGVLTLNDFHGVLLMDEPELHLHPQWQRQIIPVLHKLAPRAQIIATSHAASPWDRAYSYQRYFMAPPGDPRRSSFEPPDGVA